MFTYINKGFTYIEVLMVVGLLGIILSFGMVMGIGSVGRTSVIQERDLFVSLLLINARAQSIANNNQTAHGIHIDNTNHAYVLFEGMSYTSGASSNRTISFTNEHLSVTNTGGDTIVFAQLSGDVIQGDGTITISGNNATQNIQLNSIGRINW